MISRKHYKLLSTERYSGTYHFGSNLDTFPFHVCYSSGCLTERYQLSLVVQILTVPPFPPQWIFKGTPSTDLPSPAVWKSRIRSILRGFRAGPVFHLKSGLILSTGTGRIFITTNIRHTTQGSLVSTEAAQQVPGEGASAADLGLHLRTQAQAPQLPASGLTVQTPSHGHNRTLPRSKVQRLQREKRLCWQRQSEHFSNAVAMHSKQTKKTRQPPPSRTRAAHVRNATGPC